MTKSSNMRDKPPSIPPPHPPLRNIDLVLIASPHQNVVIHSKRVYEIQAEEGCFTSLPDLHEITENPPRSQSNEERTFTADQEYSPRSSLKRPETGDLKKIRLEHEHDDHKSMARKKERKLNTLRFTRIPCVQSSSNQIQPQKYGDVTL
ncbi:hypothetical protein DICVIV_01493 [Dictyocaulus viviparus]|uniref:Uncharacterized protein n=1 Tax=Dictyocaulus viviparus TaxID=29172 RepID=A0A0D8YCJ4_DICVI|nr:hypothetical protein DICVIV_01493 [Dictyocaulus viviparus]